jgi:hypothetical protein
MKPIHLRRSFRATTGLPQCVGERRDFIMPEGYDAVTSGRLTHPVGFFRVLEGLPGMLVSGLMFLLSLLFTCAVGVGGEVVQLGGALMIFVMGSVVVAGRHNQRVTIWPDLV